MRVEELCTRGCLTGVGIQRDEFGDEIALENRTLQPRLLYPPAWETPLQLSPNACADCINLAAYFTAAVAQRIVATTPSLHTKRGEGRCC